MKFPRRSGILLHPTSLPGRFGVGDLGDAAFQFVDFLASSGQSYWQVLPLGPTGYADSPYQTLSAFAGNPMLLSPERLVRAGHLGSAELNETSTLPVRSVDYGAVIELKSPLFKRAFSNFQRQTDLGQQESFERFCEQQAYWLEDWALFMAVKRAHELRPWPEWEREIATRRPAALRKWSAKLSSEIQEKKYLQWQFFEQLLAVKQYANDRGIRIIGDIPIFVSLDSADVWANSDLFCLDDKLRPTAVSGVPPDYFSATGQLWGHPLYDWDRIARQGYEWWISRIRMALTQADIIRIDHFRGFHNYWEVPAGEKTAIKGRWLDGPGPDLFRAVTTALGEVPIIAEDLGDFDAESRAGLDALQAEFGYPGMKVTQFAFADGATDPFLPHNYSSDSFVYTGTHDNDTILGWYQATSTERERDYARKYIGTNGSEITWDLIRLAWSSVGHTAMTTAQDLLSLGHEARMNTPGTVGPPNWCWRLTDGALSHEVATRLKDLTGVYGRLPRQGEPRRFQERKR